MRLQKKNVFRILLFVAAVLGGIGLWQVSTLAWAQEDESPRGEPMDVSLADRDGTRILQYNTTAGGLAANELVEAGQEMDVFAVSIHSGNPDDTVANPGIWQIRQATGTLTAAETVEHLFTIDGFGSAHFEFAAPLRLREGDRIDWVPLTDTPSEYIQLTLVGTPPATSAAVLK